MVSGRLPGTIIGQVFRPGTSTPRDFPRYVGIVAKGLDIKLFRDAPILRCFVPAEPLPFSGTTYTAPLGHPAKPDQTRSRLFTAEGRTVPPSRWKFVESSPGSLVFDEIEIDPTIFSSATSYFLDYIANDPALQDEVPVDDLREVLKVGDNAGQVRYKEGIDYRLVTTATGPTPGTDNLNPSGGVVTAIVPNVANTGTGTVAHNSSTYTHDYNRAYKIACTAAAGITPNRTATLVVDVFPTSSGTGAVVGRSTTQANRITLSLAEATPATLTAVAIEFGVTLNFTFGASNFVVTDKFTFNGDGPGLLELADAMTNTNQFAQVSAITDVSVVGQGSVTVNPQSDYSGAQNQGYELQCTAASGTGNSRQATFRWRTNPKLKCLTGSLTATNGSPNVTGLATQFVSEVVAGDLLIIGTDVEPVTVLTVTNATALVLTANYAPSTQTTQKTLRYRESTGSVTVLVTAPKRVVIDQGIFLDFDFGVLNTDIFSVNDEFSFSAQVASVPYNGKENRNYDITATATSTPHQLTASYSGSTATSGFGSQVFSEGTGLILPNNVVIFARNLTLNTRYDAVAPADVFDLSLSFDGLIDWSLEQDKVETVSTSEMLRDLTGNVTGVVGAFFFLLKKVPTIINFVKGPSPGNVNFTFNQVTGTTVVYFLTNPGVNLTVDYRFAGNEPLPGATYFMSGYSKRPDSDYDSPQLFFTEAAARAFLAPMTPTNDAAIANEIAWDQDAQNLPGVVVFLVKDSDGDGSFTGADYLSAIKVSEQFEATMDMVVVNQFNVRSEFRDSDVNMNDPGTAQRRIAYFGFPTNYPIGDEFTTDTRIFVARREIQVFEETVAKGTTAIIGNSFAKKTILVDAIGDGDVSSIPTQVTLDGSFLAVALAARVASFPEPWQSILNSPVSGFDEIEPLSKQQMIQLQDAGIIALRVEGSSAFYIGTMTTDNTEPSTQQLSGTVQRQYVLNRLQDTINTQVIGFVADSPEDVAQKLTGEIAVTLGSMISENKIAKYIDPATGNSRPLNPDIDILAFRDKNNPLRAYFRASWYQKYPILYVDGLVAVDAPRP